MNKCINKQWTNSSILIPRDCIHSLCNKNTSRFEEDDNESNNKANPWHFRVLCHWQNVSTYIDLTIIRERKEKLNSHRFLLVVNTGNCYPGRCLFHQF